MPKNLASQQTTVKVTPFTITNNTPSVNLSDSTADVETEVFSYQIPLGMNMGFRAEKWEDFFFFTLKTSAPASITSGTVRIKKADPTKTSFEEIWSGDASIFQGNIYDRNTRPRFSADVLLKQSQHLIVTFEGSDVVDDANSSYEFHGVKITESL